MKPQNMSEWIALALRVTLGLWFVYSGGMKLWGAGLDRFLQDIGNYQLVSPPVDVVVAYTVPWAELVAGLCFMLGVLQRGALIALCVLVTGFAVFVGWAWVQQLDISCGCHGSDAPIHYWGKAVEFALYYALLGWLWRQEKAHVDPVEQKMQNMA